MTGKFQLLTGITLVHGTAFTGVGENFAAVDGNRKIASPMDAITSGEFEDLMEGVGEEVFLVVPEFAGES
jgi:hypothetical protein